MDKLNKIIENIKGYLQGVKTELKRVAWPSKAELRSSTIIVLITLVSVTVFLWMCDSVFLKIFTKLQSF